MFWEATAEASGTYAFVGQWSTKHNHEALAIAGTEYLEVAVQPGGMSATACDNDRKASLYRTEASSIPTTTTQPLQRWPFTTRINTPTL